MTILRQRRYSADALRRALHFANISEFARAVEVDRAQMSRYMRDGFPPLAADTIAIRVGLHPSEVWPDWFEEVAV